MIGHNFSRGLTELEINEARLSHIRTTIVFLESQYIRTQKYMIDSSYRQKLLARHRADIKKVQEELEELLTKQFLLGG